MLLRNAVRLNVSRLRYHVSLPKRLLNLFAPLDTFSNRHIGPNHDESHKMLSSLGYSSMEDFVNETVPPSIRLTSGFINDQSIEPLSESELFQRAKQIASANKVMRSYIGMGYHNAVVPPVILRNVLENPAWYTPYTPYQPEIAQGMSICASHAYTDY
ncbi:hypothetical protein Clacol_003830 [Clathrus columnatus]|uniref:Glycine cleavage system P-protein N-terminal domain-containing protein n=1 Tax=Clathrus columnatus TaxID=1419009 RepID=A0AAV5A7H0_9AGAM|nr:hypothetical protein Clacol_003830 [Clathrus columnatus]